MSKKDKYDFCLTADCQAIHDLIAKLKSLVKSYEEIALEYQKYRKEGGVEIPGLEKHLGPQPPKKDPEQCKKPESKSKSESSENPDKDKQLKKKEKK
jgi:hypothetical protein